MIYLIGGPPKCGKTTLAKKLSKKLGIPWVASDTLEVVVMNYVRKYAPKKFDELYPKNATKGKTNDETYCSTSSQQIAKNYIKQAKASYAAIAMFALCEIKEGNNYIIEGYHVTPQLVAQLMKKYGRKNFRSLFLLKEDVTKFVQDVAKSSTSNDWILRKTKQKETLYKIAGMISFYSKFFETETKKYDFRSLHMDENFGEQLNKATIFLSSPNK